MATSEEVVGRTIVRIIDREGGFTDNPADRGGATNFGITLVTLAAWRHSKGRAVTTTEDVRNLTISEAMEIYRWEYVEKPGFLTIEDPELFDLVVDSGVNHGPDRAAKFLQEALGVKADGDIGPKTRGALARSWIPQVYRDVIAARLRFYGRFISKDRTDADRDGIPDATEFASGWLNRLSEFVRRCPGAPRTAT